MATQQRAKSYPEYMALANRIDTGLAQLGLDLWKLDNPKATQKDLTYGQRKELQLRATLLKAVAKAANSHVKEIESYLPNNS